MSQTPHQTPPLAPWQTPQPTARNLAIGLVRVFLAGTIALIAIVQVLFLPWLSGELAAGLPAEAHMRWPILALSIAGLACVQIGVLCVIALLTRIRRRTLFAPGTARWLDGLTAAFFAGSAICSATLVYQSMTVSGPPLWAFALLFTAGAGVALALTTWIGRTVLIEVSDAYARAVPATPAHPARLDPASV